MLEMLWLIDGEAQTQIVPLPVPDTGGIHNRCFDWLLI